MVYCWEWFLFHTKLLSSSSVTVFFSKISFKQHFTSNISFIYSSQPRRSIWIKVPYISWNSILLRFIICKIWTVILRREVHVPLLPQNHINPLMHADALYEDNNSKQIPRVVERVNKNIQALYVLLLPYIFCMNLGPA